MVLFINLCLDLILKFYCEVFYTVTENMENRTKILGKGCILRDDFRKGGFFKDISGDKTTNTGHF